MSIKADLREFSIFSGLSDDELSMLSDVARERYYAAGEKIIEKDDTGASLFLIYRGNVRVVFPKSEGDDIQLDRLGQGEFFGEMSLFDGEPRSAVVFADSDTIVIEIQRDEFLDQIKNQPDLALRILGIMANRVRHSDDRIGEIADRVYRETYPRIDQVLTTQLEAAKVIYEKTEDRASNVLTNVERSWTTLTRFITIILGVASIIAGVLAFLGYSQFKDMQNTIQGKFETIVKQSESTTKAIQGKFDDIVAQSEETTKAMNQAREKIAVDVLDIEKQRKAAESKLKEIDRMSEDASIAKEIALQIGRIKLDFNRELHRGDDDPVNLRRLAIRFGDAEKILFKEYLSNFEDWQPEIVLEAAMTYVQFIDRLEYYPKDEKIQITIDALLHVLGNEKTRNWRLRAQVREGLVTLATANNGAWKHLVSAPLREKLGSSDADLDISRILFDIGAADEKSKKLLLVAMLSEKSDWARLAAAAQLIRENEDAAWRELFKDIRNSARVGFVSAYSLAQFRPEELVAFGICEYRKLLQNQDPLQIIFTRLQQQLKKESGQQSGNPFRNRHIAYLAEQFSQHSCPPA